MHSQYSLCCELQVLVKEGLDGTNVLPIAVKQVGVDLQDSNNKRLFTLPDCLPA